MLAGGDFAAPICRVAAFLAAAADPARSRGAAPVLPAFCAFAAFGFPAIPARADAVRADGARGRLAPRIPASGHIVILW
jgi:hypothetical protein